MHTPHLQEILHALAQGVGLSHLHAKIDELGADPITDSGLAPAPEQLEVPTAPTSPAAGFPVDLEAQAAALRAAGWNVAPPASS